jgi:hypothetical protein
MEARVRQVLMVLLGVLEVLAESEVQSVLRCMPEVLKDTTQELVRLFLIRMQQEQ